MHELSVANGRCWSTLSLADDWSRVSVKIEPIVGERESQEFRAVNKQSRPRGAARRRRETGVTAWHARLTVRFSSSSEQNHPNYREIRREDSFLSLRYSKHVCFLFTFLFFFFFLFNFLVAHPKSGAHRSPTWLASSSKNLGLFSRRTCDIFVPPLAAHGTRTLCLCTFSPPTPVEMRFERTTSSLAYFSSFFRTRVDPNVFSFVARILNTTSRP